MLWEEGKTQASWHFAPAHDIAEFKLQFFLGGGIPVSLQGFKDGQEADPERAPACALGDAGRASITWVVVQEMPGQLWAWGHAHPSLPPSPSQSDARSFCRTRICRWIHLSGSFGPPLTQRGAG